jgi:hypothetical protein
MSDTPPAGSAQKSARSLRERGFEFLDEAADLARRTSGDTTGNAIQATARAAVATAFFTAATAAGDR